MGNIVANYDMDTHTIAMCDMRFDTVQNQSARVQVLNLTRTLAFTTNYFLVADDVSINSEVFMITSSISRYVGSVFWR
uniref:Uncharacterized protein n=1 Tax=Oryza glumipatula TaxID=40148 RepID=A0A0D9YFX4_9ORYZ